MNIYRDGLRAHKLAKGRQGPKRFDEGADQYFITFLCDPRLTSFAAAACSDLDHIAYSNTLGQYAVTCGVVLVLERYILLRMRLEHRKDV